MAALGDFSFAEVSQSLLLTDCASESPFYAAEERAPELWFMEPKGRGFEASWEAGCCYYHYHMVIDMLWQPGPFRGNQLCTTWAGGLVGRAGRHNPGSLRRSMVTACL